MKHKQTLQTVNQITVQSSQGKRNYAQKIISGTLSKHGYDILVHTEDGRIRCYSALTLKHTQKFKQFDNSNGIPIQLFTINTKFSDILKRGFVIEQNLIKRNVETMIVVVNQQSQVNFMNQMMTSVDSNIDVQQIVKMELTTDHTQNKRIFSTEDRLILDLGQNISQICSFDLEKTVLLGERNHQNVNVLVVCTFDGQIMLYDLV